VPLLEQAREAVDGAQRRTQVVRHRVGERLQLAVGRVERLGALDHLALQLHVELLQPLLGRHLLRHVAPRAVIADEGAVRVVQRPAADGGPVDAPVGAPALEQQVAELLAPLEQPRDARPRPPRPC
jgi:hypothetical protein